MNLLEESNYCYRYTMIFKKESKKRRFSLKQGILEYKRITSEEAKDIYYINLYQKRLKKGN